MQEAPCWNRYFDGFVLTSNNVDSMSLLRVDDNGALSLVSNADRIDEFGFPFAAQISVPIDHEFSPDGQFVYVISTNAWTRAAQCRDL